MLMHILADPAMTIVSGVGVGNLKNKCHLFVWVSRPGCMPLTGIMSNLITVKEP